MMPTSACATVLSPSCASAAPFSHPAEYTPTAIAFRRALPEGSPCPHPVPAEDSFETAVDAAQQDADLPVFGERHGTQILRTDKGLPTVDHNHLGMDVWPAQCPYSDPGAANRRRAGWEQYADSHVACGRLH